jgi:Flp pilus assembly protein TadD
MAGGGTQAFFSRFPDGTLRFLPFDYSRAAGTWFCNTRRRIDQGGVLITAAIALADCADWTPNRILGSTDRFQGCQQCHGSQIGLEFSADLHRYDTHYTTLAINCESCHGPGKRHVELARSGKIRENADIGMTALEPLSRDQSLQVCFQCHAVKSQLQAGYLPGKSFEKHYALKLPLVLDTIYYADGRTRTFAYQEGHLSSDCYLSGSMTCVDCHDPHTQHYRDIKGTALPGRFSDGQCLDCHPSKAEPVERHTHHPAASDGSRCVSCHMPYLQQPEVGKQIRYARSDHTIPIPRPAFDSRLGVDNACAQCHRDRPVAQLQADVEKWYGQIKPLRSTIQALVSGDSVTDAATFADRVLLPDHPDAVGVFHGLSDVLARETTPGTPELGSRAAHKTEDIGRREDLELQALALATLHLTRTDDRRAGRFITQRMTELQSRGVPVRGRWVWILKSRGDIALRSGDYQGAVAAYQRAGQLQPDDPMIPLNLGSALGRLGRVEEAYAQFQRSLELNPALLQAMLNLGTTQLQRGDLAGALAMFRSAVAMHPADPLGYANLGLALARADSATAAIPALERAVTLDPSLADAHFVLGSAYASLGRLPEAETEVRTGLEFDPKNAGAAQLLDEIQSRRKTR